VPLVGRVAELAALSAALDRAADGRGGVLLVRGEAGIGKTRLVEELADRARARDMTVLRGRCIDLAGSVAPYHALIEALRAASGGAAFDGAGGQLRVFDDVRDLLTDATPLLLVLEDLHWADESTVDFVAYVARAAGDRGIVVVATYRADEIAPAGALLRLTVELQRAGDAGVLDLAPLTAGELSALLEEAAGRELPEELTSTIAMRSGGNPFFAQELLAAAERGERALPRLLRDAVLQRVAGVDDDCRAVLRVAAAIGRDVPYRLLVALGPVGGAALDAALRAAVEHGILMPDPDAVAFRFRHALLAEAVYATILPGEREALHERIAGALAAAGGEPAELARHWSVARRPTEALAASLAAARAAEAVSGLAEAAGHLERAVAAWPDVPAAEAIAGADLPAVLARTAELADLTGSGARAAGFARRAIDLVDATAEPVRAALLHERLAGYLLPVGDRVGALTACHRAVSLVPAEPPSAERAAVLTTLGNALMLSWRHAESREVCAEALAVAARIGDARPALRARGILGIDLCYLGRPDEAEASARETLRLAGERGTARDVAHAYAMWCEILIATGRPAEAVGAATEGLRAAGRLGVGGSFGSLLAAYAAEGCLETGDWDRADTLLSGARRAGTAFWGHFPRLLRAQLAIGRGAFATARECLAAVGADRPQPTSAARHARVEAELALWEGRPEAAVEAIEAGIAGTPAGRDDVHGARFGALALRALADGGDTSGADGWLARARAAAGRAAAVTPDAAAWLTVAEAEHARSVGAGDRWPAAVAAWDRLGRPHPAAYCRWRWAEALQATGRAGWETTRVAREALRIADRLGAAPLRRELELFAQRCRVDLVGPPPASPRPVARFGLTAREAEVLRLLTRGYTNREIAGELGISPKTASVHVTHIMRKLGVARRADAAAVAHRLAAR
jgi:DNA-binding CsgD family transcriptional regulator/tetratricopeptide (TPR) repeat protein